MSLTGDETYRRWFWHLEDDPSETILLRIFFLFITLDLIGVIYGSLV